MEDYRTAAIFKKYGIDFCCKGRRTVKDACEKKKFSAENIYEELKNLPKTSENRINFSDFPLDLLADYVEKTHHR